MDALLIKTQDGWVPGDSRTSEYHQKCKMGQECRAKMTNMRNAAFHRKMFALFDVAFDMWNPGEIDSKWGAPEKNFDRFRKDLTILAGYYDVVIRVDGSTRVQAKSISFASMDNDEFEKLYSAVIDVIIKKIIPKYSRDDVDEMVERVLQFA